jgi:hypothetical protein
VFTQKASAPADNIQPITDVGVKNRPAGLNHRIDFSPAVVAASFTEANALQS